MRHGGSTKSRHKIHFNYVEQEDVDCYFQSMLHRKPIPAEAQFKHFVYGLKCYLKAMDRPVLEGLSLPKIRRSKKLPIIFSTQSIVHLLNICDIYPKMLFAVIYDCGLRAFETCNLKWNDIDFDRHQVHIHEGKGSKDRIVPISSNTLVALRRYRSNYPSMNYVFKSFGSNDPIKPSYIRNLLKDALHRTGLNESLTIHSLRHSYATHLLEAGEDIQTVQQRLGHKNVSTTMVYLHIAKIANPTQCICLLDEIVTPQK